MDVPRETLTVLELYRDLLLKWQTKINLISPGTVQNAWERHFEDSLQLLLLMPDGAKVVYDLGSGAGFPGLVLAMARPDLTVSLIESDSKKCAFLQTVSRETGVAVSIVNQRIEAAADALPAPDLIVARALAPLESLLNYCVPWLKSNPDLSFVFPKGETFAADIKQAEASGWRFELSVTSSKTDSRAAILSLSHVHKA